MSKKINRIIERIAAREEEEKNDRLNIVAFIRSFEEKMSKTAICKTIGIKPQNYSRTIKTKNSLMSIRKLADCARLLIEANEKNDA